MSTTINYLTGTCATQRELMINNEEFKNKNSKNTKSKIFIFQKTRSFQYDEGCEKKESLDSYNFTISSKTNKVKRPFLDVILLSEDIIECFLQSNVSFTTDHLLSVSGNDDTNGTTGDAVVVIREGLLY